MGDRSKRRRLREFLKKGDFDCCLLQETIRSGLSDKAIKSVCSFGLCEWVANDAVGQSKGLLSIWKKDILEVISTFNGNGFLGVEAKQGDKKIYLINVYSLCSLFGKRELWKDLIRLKEEAEDGECLIGGDFNAVTSKKDRRGSSETSSAAERREFRQFIEGMELVDPPVLGKVLSWFGHDGISMSRIDRWLLNIQMEDICTMD